MSSEQKKVRHKRWATKTRSGCLVCKARRVKCDESKPACRKCFTTGRPCQYAPNDTTSNAIVHSTQFAEFEQGLGAVVRTAIIMQPPISAAPPGVRKTEAEEHMFHFFRTAALSRMKDQLDSKIWIGDFLRAAHVYPAIWHATNALAASFRGALTIAPEKPLQNSILKQNNLTIMQLQRVNYTEIAPAEKVIVLWSALLLSWTAILQGDVMQCFIHFDHGIRLYSKWFAEDQGCPKSSRFSLQNDSLKAAYARFDNQARIIRGVYEQESPSILPHYDIEAPITSIQKGYIEFEYLLNRSLRRQSNTKRNDGVHGPHEQEESIIQSSFAMWDRKMDIFAATPVAKSEENKLGICLMRIRRLFVQILMDYSPDEKEPGYDRFLPEFERIVTLSEDAKKSGSLIEDPRIPVFSCSAALSEPLCMVACHCRQPILRWRAVRILRSEVEARSKSYLGCAESVAAMEEFMDRQSRPCCPTGVERGSEGTICAAHRISAIQIQVVAPETKWQLRWRANPQGQGMEIIIPSATLPTSVVGLTGHCWVSLPITWTTAEQQQPSFSTKSHIKNNPVRSQPSVKTLVQELFGLNQIPGDNKEANRGTAETSPCAGDEIQLPVVPDQADSRQVSSDESWTQLDDFDESIDWAAQAGTVLHAEEWQISVSGGPRWGNADDRNITTGQSIINLKRAIGDLPPDNCPRSWAQYYRNTRRPGTDAPKQQVPGTEPDPVRTHELHQGSKYSDVYSEHAVESPDSDKGLPYLEGISGHGLRSLLWYNQVVTSAHIKR